MLIGIDHGNQNIKTAHTVMASGLVKHTTRPIAGEVLQFEGNFYTPSETRLPFAWDKTKNDDFYLLSLFAIAHELEERGAYRQGEVMHIELAVGLPPSDFGGMYKRFQEYFLRPRSSSGITEFGLNGKSYFIKITDAAAFPQDYAAAMTMYSSVRTMRRAVIVDIGGITADYMFLHSGTPDLSISGSFEHGVIVLYNRLKEKIRGEHGLLVDEGMIDCMLRGEDVLYRVDILKDIQNTARDFVSDLVGKLRERGVDLRTTPSVFAGGGSILLYPYFNAGQMAQSVLIHDVCANAVGYEKLYRAACQSIGV